VAAAVLRIAAAVLGRGKKSAREPMRSYTSVVLAEDSTTTI